MSDMIRATQNCVGVNPVRPVEGFFLDLRISNTVSVYAEAQMW